MRIAVLAVLGLVTAAPLAHGQEATGWAAKLFRTEDGKIPTGHDFGTVPRGAMLQHRFPITNIYAVPLQIVTSPDCGCVTATATPQVLQPRETGFLDVTMDTTRFNGPKRVELYVTVSSPNQQFSSTAALAITGLCRMDVTLHPAQAEFGMVSRGQALAKPAGELRRPAALADRRGQRVGPVRRAATAGGPPGRPGELRGAVVPEADAPAGIHRGDLNLLTNDPNNRLVPIPYDVTVLAPLTASPDVAASARSRSASRPRRAGDGARQRQAVPHRRAWTARATA